MGFTIDMVSGDILEETSPQMPKASPVEDSRGEMSNFEYSEQLISIYDTSFEDATEISMPESVSQTDIDSFLDKFS